MYPSNYSGAYTNVVSGQEYAQQYMAGHQQYVPNDPRYQAQACTASPEPASFYPYSGTQAAASYDSAFPNEEDMSSLSARGCPVSHGAGGYQLNVNSLMPAAWRSNTQSCGESGAAAVEGSQWSKYAPTKDAFDRYITAQGSARLSLTTRNPLGRIVGIPDLLRQAPPMPLAAENVVFGDSSFRQDLIFKSLGRYPAETNC
jgi:hypothetical protein